MHASPADERIPLSTKLFYGAGDLTNSLFNTILAVHVLYFLINVVGLPGGLASIALPLVALLLDASGGGGIDRCWQSTLTG
jgi:Na+/melibiose symporter-like transporter